MSKQDEDELKKIRISATELRKFKGFETLSDEKAEETINLLLKLSEVCYSNLKNAKILNYKNRKIENFGFLKIQKSKNSL